jgi:ubiquinone/menaquinone biosynthesis C-methylase UbiE
VEESYRFLIPPGQRVLEMVCGEGNLLASLKPSYGVAIDFSKKMNSAAQKKHPHHH